MSVSVERKTSEIAHSKISQMYDTFLEVSYSKMCFVLDCSFEGKCNSRWLKIDSRSGIEATGQSGLAKRSSYYPDHVGESTRAWLFSCRFRFESLIISLLWFLKRRKSNHKLGDCLLLSFSLCSCALLALFIYDVESALYLKDTVFYLIDAVAVEERWEIFSFSHCWQRYPFTLASHMLSPCEAFPTQRDINSRLAEYDLSKV